MDVANMHSHHTQYGNFYDFCRDSTLPVCNLFRESPVNGGSGWGSCQLTGIPLSGGRHLTNLGSILLCGIAILVTLLLLWRSERKRAAVGRREMQLFLIGYLIIEICEIFTVGGFPLERKVRIGFTAVHIAAIVANSWILLMNALVGFQLLDDGTPLSIGLILLSAAAFFIGTGYIVLDTGFSWTGFFDSDLVKPDRSYAIYTLYQLVPLVFLFLYFVLETYLVIKVLGEKKPMLYLIAATLLFAVGQIFQYVISTHICRGTHGKINGALFETFFTLCAVVMLWVFWSSITEDDWPMPAAEAPYT
ncbi:hypothetical protein L228DRAFT_269908 [Xylona heveae TC161]|uniref:Uncharacterized protein n=1 Tax=Xylona heveae (strain CBS 132557 / TC161) TaxID=1328760 RepID=A0A165AJY2_XYLHT|nr:hypothetical protein L228DRAFT_269908 [Xylona heveae TC161]KZF20605.1 hypothetical protein L228DRAFT_269908 [Xylona heveae TC161]